MKKTALLITLIIFATAFACKKSDSKSSSYTPECTSTTPAYQADVSPLILSNCATSGCHASGSSNGPGALTTYAQVKAASAVVRSSVVNGSMPKNGTLISAQKNTIVCWIDAGANP